MSAPDPRTTGFYDRSVHAVARDLIGCVVRHGATAGRIVETESYHETEAACHAHIGLTERTRPLLGPPGVAYVYRSYGIHSLLNAVVEPEGTGAAVLVRALEPVAGIEEMRARRGLERLGDLCSGPGKLTQALRIGLELMRTRRGLDRPEDLCSGPAKLTQALGIDLGLNGSSLVHGPIEVLARERGAAEPRIAIGERIGITKAADLPWRFCDADSRHVSRPWPAPMRRGRSAA